MKYNDQHIYKLSHCCGKFLLQTTRTKWEPLIIYQQINDENAPDFLFELLAEYGEHEVIIENYKFKPKFNSLNVMEWK